MAKSKKSTTSSPPELPVYDVFTDGSWRPPNYGAYAYVILKDGKEHACVSQSVFNTTINRMELQAIAEALSSFTEISKINIHSDSQYSVNCIMRWAHKWHKDGWLTLQGEPVKNRDLIEPIFHLTKLHDVRVIWLRGHNGHEHNERCDKLAQSLTRAMVAKQILPPTLST